MISREGEVSEMRQFLRRPSACLVLSGEAGIGKTTLWVAGLEAAEAQGYVVVSTRASQAEVALSFAALADLVDGLDPEVLSGLPAPQLRALEVALRRRDLPGEMGDQFAISAGFLSAIRASAERGPFLIAIDDVQWLDTSSADCVLFAARRLSGTQAKFLLTRRSESLSELERELQTRGVDELKISPLSFGATSRVVSEKLGVAFTRRVLRQVHESSQGNPLFALELSRLLVARGMPEIGTELPVPSLANDVFAARVRDLNDAERRALLAVALSAGMSRSELSTLVDPLVIDDAMASGLLVVDRSGARPTHPMLAAAARQYASAKERRDLHMDLSSAVGDPTLRARHLAIATFGPDGEVAAEVAAVAEVAAKHGAAHDAEELGAHALRLTPRNAPERADRVLALGRFHLRADDMTRVNELLTEGMRELPAGRARAIAHLLLGEASNALGDEAHAELALEEAGEDPEVRSLALGKKSRLLTGSSVERIDQAEMWAVEALAAAQLVGSDIEDRARTILGWARILRGRPIDDLTWSQQPADRPRKLSQSPMGRLTGAGLVFRGQIEEARVVFQQILADADERGDFQSARLIHQQLCELELRAGRVREAARWLDQLDYGPTWMREVRARLQALMAATSGDPTGTTRWAHVVLDEGSGHVQVWDRLEAIRAVGLAALFEHDATRAVQSLRHVWEHTVREHVDNPGAFPVAGDLVVAFVQAGDVDAANALTERLRSLAEEQEHPWGLVTARRCAASEKLARGYSAEAAVDLADTADEYARLGLGFDRAQTLLFLGGVERRSNKRAAARISLEAASAQFEADGCSGWAEQARAELGRVGGRRSSDGRALTKTERRVVDLAISGLSNKEIATRLFVSVNTVEGHLSRVYAKLGVRSRSQLMRRLDDAEGEVAAP